MIEDKDLKSSDMAGATEEDRLAYILDIPFSRLPFQVKLGIIQKGFSCSVQANS